jgi:hypothetical protein
MATTAKELIEILQKYTKPDEYVIWQYYTRGDFDYDDNQPPLTNKEFGAVADEVSRWDIWEGVPDLISDEIYSHQNKKGQE